MSSGPYFCGHPRRRSLVRDARDEAGEPVLNGIDHLEVDPDNQRLLHVHFIHPVPGETGGVPAAPLLGAANFAVEGGVRVANVGVEDLVALDGRVVTLRVDRAGDFSAYTLRLVASAVDRTPPGGFDPVLASVGFSFKVNCASDTDCLETTECAHERVASPYLNYLAKDYASFRQLMFDRLSATLPGWRDRNPADVGVMLVELLAYAGDHLSYYQDAVATEAYLGTARQRISVRRHGRLVDYHLHDGSNARAWLVFETDNDRGTALAPALPTSTRVATAAAGAGADGRIVFETLHEVTTLRVAGNAIRFYTWGDSRCCLPRGATTATLVGKADALGLARGDALVFEEVLGATTGLPEDADRTHRHVVRLDGDPHDRVDPLTDTPVVEIRWHERDALPFALCLAEFDDGAGGTKPAAVARGNVALADHGLTVDSSSSPETLVPSRVPPSGRYRPTLAAVGLTCARAYDDEVARQRPAADATTANPREALPVVELRGGGDTWRPRRDLLGAAPFAAAFVAEMDDDGRARLRFGDGVFGRVPSAGTRFGARYRVGNGSAGNVGVEALKELSPGVEGVSVRNPLAASGGTDPEPTREARLYAPQAFRSRERAVTEADYAEAAERHPDVQRAAATRRWTGSWHTMFVTIDRRGGRPVDAAFEAEMRGFLERFRMAGYDLEIDAPRFVPLDVALRICVQSRAYRGAVLQALRTAFGTGTQPDGSKGFFHPDRFTFGQPVVLSQLRARALDVPGVGDLVEVVRFQRFGHAPHGEIDRGFIAMHRLEIARLDNDPSAQERGQIDFLLEGGL